MDDYLCMMNLYFRESGQGRPLIILHGLFGSSDNWYSQAKVLAEKFRVFVVDQRNHGQSPHSDDFNYQLLADDLRDFIVSKNIERPVILGHSMGGKTAMNLAVAHPELLSELIVVDIVPKTYPVHHDHILDGLNALQLNAIKSRQEADQELAKYVPEPEVRQFLLKNLTRSDGGFAWRINLPAIDKHIEEIGAGMILSGKYMGRTLFVLGKKSNYYVPGDDQVIHDVFPNAEIVFMDTGHWVQAEKPVEFTKLILQHLG